jgi:hypothetical protein
MGKGLKRLIKKATHVVAQITVMPGVKAIQAVANPVAKAGIFGVRHDNFRVAGIRMGSDLVPVVNTAISVAATIAGGPAGGVLASAYTTAASGGNDKQVTNAILVSGATAGVGAAASTITSVAGQVAVQAAGTGVIAAATGQNVVRAVLGSVAGSAVKEIVPNIIPKPIAQNYAAPILANAAEAAINQNLSLSTIVSSVLSTAMHDLHARMSKEAELQEKIKQDKDIQDKLNLSQGVSRSANKIKTLSFNDDHFYDSAVELSNLNLHYNDEKFLVVQKKALEFKTNFTDKMKPDDSRYVLAYDKYKKEMQPLYTDWRNDLLDGLVQVKIKTDEDIHDRIKNCIALNLKDEKSESTQSGLKSGISFNSNGSIDKVNLGAAVISSSGVGVQHAVNKTTSTESSLKVSDIFPGGLVLEKSVTTTQSVPRDAKATQSNPEGGSKSIGGVVNKQTLNETVNYCTASRLTSSTKLLRDLSNSGNNLVSNTATQQTHLNVEGCIGDPAKALVASSAAVLFAPALAVVAPVIPLALAPSHSL